MNVLIVADGHYMQDNAGNIYAESVYSYDFYKRYLMVFDKVYAIVRLEKVDYVPRTAKLCSGPNVEFLGLPPYRGPIQYLKKYHKIRKLAQNYIDNVPCAIFRLPAATSNLICKLFIKTKKPFAVEIVVDPWEKFSPLASPNKFSPIVRVVWTKFIKRACIIANGTSYVTREYLQKKYPPHESDGFTYFSSNYSSVELPDNLFAQPRKFKKKHLYTIVHVSNAFTDNAKGHVPLMKTLKGLLDRGYNVEVKFIGDGPKLKEFKEYAIKLGINKYVKFLGRLPDGAAVRKIMRECDIFVFPTRAEGLPRVLLEAMAEGLPALSSPVCGIPEILDKEFLCTYDNIEEWVNAIIRFINNPELMSRVSKDNLEIAKTFSSSNLNYKRKNFYSQLKKLTIYKESKEHR